MRRLICLQNKLEVEQRLLYLASSVNYSQLESGRAPAGFQPGEEGRLGFSWVSAGTRPGTGWDIPAGL